MNPRNGLPQPADPDELRKRRITRRGMPYDEVGRIPEDKINEISDDMLDDNQPSDGVGLLFMCYQKSIEGQFEILQGFWTEGNFGSVTVEGEDSLIGHGTKLDKTLPVQWGQPAQTPPFTFSRFIKNLGGE
jgi:deferrochelatase/peroxidase EfeB